MNTLKELAGQFVSEINEFEVLRIFPIESILIFLRGRLVLQKCLFSIEHRGVNAGAGDVARGENYRT